MSERRPVADLAQRARALEPSQSFIVQAPAGSGKTELLIQRYLALLASVERPEEIAAITFTRKASAEMRKRIFEALRLARQAPRPDRGHKALTWDLAQAALQRNDALHWELEENTARLRIQTIDALCASLTRQMPVLSRFGAQPESIDDASAHYREAARNTLALVEDSTDSHSGDVAHLLSHLDNHAGQVEALLATMLRHRDHWIRNLHGAGDRDLLEASLSSLRDAIIDEARALLPGDLPPPGEDAPEAWTAFANSLLTQKGEWRKRHPLHDSLCGNDALCTALVALQALLPGRYSEPQWEALGAITRLLPRAVAELKLVFAAHGEADFVEISQGALRALGTEDAPTDLMLALDYRIRHILVDEFQDTSFTQFELLEKLTAGWEPDDGRTLFVVGDPMQSIYRFRQAEVGLFLRARRDGLGHIALEPLTLSANFRSQEGLVDWVNASFQRVMPAREDIAAGAVAYARSDAVHEPQPDGVAVHPFVGEGAASEAGRVVQLVQRAMQLPGREPGVPSTTAILVRNRNHLAEIVPQLRQAGLAFRAIEIEPLASRPVVRDLLALARALSHLADRTAWLAVLRAPWCGLCLADLHILAASGDDDERVPRTIWEAIADERKVSLMSADGQARLQRTRDVLAHFISQRRRASLRDAVEGAWLSLGGPACVAGATELEDAQTCLDYLEETQVAGALPDLAAFEEGFAKLHAAPDLEASERLQVMTIHKAKGLEFDTVILPGLGAGSGRDARQLLLWMESAHGLLLGPINPTGGDDDPIYEHIRGLDKTRAGHESGRLLYVAATRARQRLDLLGVARRNKAGEVVAGKGSLLAKLWEGVAAEFAALRDPSPAAGDAPRAAALSLSRLPAEWKFPAVPAGVSWNCPEEAARDNDVLEFSWVGETARHVGSVVHRWLQRLAEDSLQEWTVERIASLRPRIAGQLAYLGVGEQERPAAIDRVVKALTRTVGDERGRWLLGAHAGARNEYRVSAVIDGRRQHVVIDRYFVDAQTGPWIVDYKTGSHEGSDVQGFLDRESRRYAPQLRRYATVMAASGAARLGLYFPLMQGWRELPAQAGD